jgi:type II secretory pathway component GspD/PulD (secretin)
MRKICLLVALLAWSAFFAKADGTKTDLLPAGMIDFKGATVSQVLDIYGKLSGLQLDISPDVLRRGPGIKFRTEKPVSKDEVLGLLEKVLSEQADVIITKTDDKHAKVTLKEKKPEKPADH